MKRRPDVDKEQMTRADMKFVGKSIFEKEQMTRVGAELIIKAGQRTITGTIEIVPQSVEDKKAVMTYCQEHKITTFINSDGFIELK